MPAMSDTIIQVENLGKKYTIGHQQNKQEYNALRDIISNKSRDIVRRFQRGSRPKNPTTEDFWALKDVSFEVEQGDRIGIIGRNGAGKSTLLKVLSRITEPTVGQVRIKGRVASLLEVGTGFHPELTGRENIFLNGAILGMGKTEIHRKFDEIVAFAEVEKFLDTPVKRYSSGMYVRLAFSVAAHLEPEILIVDEVLAVGDAKFQNKCLGRMKDVSEEGRIVIFVSHNMGAIRSMCSTGVLLERGQMKLAGNINTVLDTYFRDITSSSQDKYYSQPSEKGEPKIIEIQFPSAISGSQHNTRDSIRLTITFAAENVDYPVIGLHIYNCEGVEVVHTSSEFCPDLIRSKPTDVTEKTIVVEIPSHFLNVGKYRC